jgi:hypothetical protein
VRCCGKLNHALAGRHGEYDIVLANPPFGKESSVTIVNEAGEQSNESPIIIRDDFWASTSKKLTSTRSSPVTFARTATNAPRVSGSRVSLTTSY